MRLLWTRLGRVPRRTDRPSRHPARTVHAATLSERAGRPDVEARRRPRGNVVARNPARFGTGGSARAAYCLPFLIDGAAQHARSYVLYCDVLLLLTALDGGERILDRLVEVGARSVRLEDRWGWRSRLHLPTHAWRTIEAILRWADDPQAELGDRPTSVLEAMVPDGSRGRTSPSSEWTSAWMADAIWKLTLRNRTDLLTLTGPQVQ